MRQLAASQWRFDRVARLGTNFSDHTIGEEVTRWERKHDGDPNDDTLTKLSRYELRLTHRYNRALTRLAWLQEQRTRSTVLEELAPKIVRNSETNPIPAKDTLTSPRS